MNPFRQISDRRPLTYSITTGDLTDENFPLESEKTLSAIKSAVQSGIDLIQIREKKLGSRNVLRLAQMAREITKEFGANLLVNERFDIALAAGADGVHLTSRSIPTILVRQKVGQDLIVGVSTHSLWEAETARSEGADFLTFSPIFETDSKKAYGAPQGIEKLRRVCDKLDPFPVFALGGVDETNYRSALDSGAQGIAAIRFFNDRVRIPNLHKLFDD